MFLEGMVLLLQSVLFKECPIYGLLPVSLFQSLAVSTNSLVKPYLSLAQFPILHPFLRSSRHPHPILSPLSSGRELASQQFHKDFQVGEEVASFRCVGVDNARIDCTTPSRLWR